MEHWLHDKTRNRLIKIQRETDIICGAFKISPSFVTDFSGSLNTHLFDLHLNKTLFDHERKYKS